MKILTLVLLSISMMASAQDYGRGGDRGGRGPGQQNGHGGRQDKVCFYAHAGYQGSSFCLEEGEQALDLSRQYGMNDQISSIRIFGQSRVVIYVDAGMRGDSVVVDSDVYNLSDLRRRSGGSWNDVVSSIVVRQDRGGNGGGHQPPPPPQRRDSICFYRDINYQGASFCIDETDRMQDIRDLSRAGSFNDQISSIRINGRGSVTVYEHANMSGQRASFNRDVPNLTQLGKASGGNWNDIISSLDVRF